MHMSSTKTIPAIASNEYEFQWGREVLFLSNGSRAPVWARAFTGPGRSRAACRGAAEAAAIDYPWLVYPHFEKHLKLATAHPAG